MRMSGSGTQYNDMASFIILGEVAGMIEGNSNLGRYSEDFVGWEVCKHWPGIYLFYDRDMNG